MMTTTNASIGTAGYSFPHWKGPFYPRNMAPGKWLSYYAEHFNSLEVNTTFYTQPRAPMLERWASEVPSDFSFTLKMNRVVTHEKGLKNIRGDLLSFLREASALGDKLSCILFQLPPYFLADIPLLANAVEEAAHAVEFMPTPPRLAWEFRHPSWNNDHVLKLLRNYGSAMVIHDAPGGCGWIVGTDERKQEQFLLAHEIRMSLQEWAELFRGSFCYVRFHGTVEGEARREYDAERLRPWADFCAAALAHNLPLYGYFKNDPGAAAVRDALKLSSMLGVARIPDRDARQMQMTMRL
jgi:uncharacterized protein YecE (DUF72 family)